MTKFAAVLALQLLQPATAILVAATHLSGTLFSWHPALMSIGFLGLIGQGILTSHAARRLQGPERSRLLVQHALWQASGLLAVAAAFWAVYQSKEIRGTPHFTNLHSWTGLATMTLSVASAAGGAVAFGKTGLLQFVPKDLQPVIKAAHRNAGVVTILVSTVAIELGLVMPTAYQGALSHWLQGIIAIMALLVAYLAWAPEPAKSQSKSQ